MENKNEVSIITKSELNKSDLQIMNAKQLDFILQKTPKAHIYKRPAKGKGEWSYVTGVYVKKVLNLAFGWDWSFEIVEYKFDLQVKQAFVLGKLTVNTGGRSIVKMQFGRVDIKFKRSAPDEPMDIGNDLKAAATDALKKCASELGIASDVYAPNEFKSIRVIEEVSETDKLEELIELFSNVKQSDLSTEDYLFIEMVIDTKDAKNYDKIIKKLKAL